MANRYADRPYKVGKGKPPVESQFKHGQKPPKKAGRPPGAKAKKPLRKFLDEQIPVPDKNGKIMMMTLEEAMDKRLIHKAVQDGDLRAIALVKKLIAELEKVEAGQPLSADEIIRQREEERERERLAEQLRRAWVDMLNFAAMLKKLGLLEYKNGQPYVPAWAIEAAKIERAARRKRMSGPLAPPD